MLINAWFHFFIATDAPEEMFFKIEECKFSRFYTHHSLLTLNEPISAINIDDEKFVEQFLYYFTGMYVVGFPTFYFVNDVVQDVNGNVFVAGIFTKMTIDMDMARRQALLMMRMLKVSDSLILDFLNNLKTELCKQKYEIYLKNPILNNLFSICKWKELINELLQLFNGEEL